jgi:nitroreductase
MNQTLDVIMKRRSTRVYSEDTITDDEKSTILEATLRAPTGGNMMLYSIVELDSQDLKDRLSETCDHQPFIAKAPWVLLYLADFQRQYDYFDYCEVPRLCRERNIPYRTPEAADLMLACCDALIAAQTTVLAAESLGIGSCYIGDIMENYEAHRDLLRLPKYAFPIALLCLGRPARELSEKSRSSRFEREFIVYKNAYRRLSSEDFKHMYAPLEPPAGEPRRYFKDSENIGQSLYLRKTSAEFSLEMIRSVKVMLENWK